MNVSKININQSERSYYIASDIYDVSYHNNGATFESLSSLLSSDNLSTLIPTQIRNGGMSIRFIQSSDNKYVHFHYTGTEINGTSNPFLNTENWIGEEDMNERIISLEEDCADASSTISKSGGPGVQFIPSDFGLSVFKKGTIVLVNGTTNGTNFTLYGNKGSGNENILNEISQNKYNPSSVILEDNYQSLYAYSDNASHFKVSVSLQSRLSYADESVNQLKEGQIRSIFLSSKSFSSGGSAEIAPSQFGLQVFEKDMIIEVYGETNGTNLLFYGNRGNGNENLIANVSRDINKPSVVLLNADYNKFYYYSNSATDVSINVSIYGKSAYVDKEIQDLKNSVQDLEDSVNNPPCRVLYLGDSYTQMGRWTAEFENMINVSEKLNLGVSSANLKDLKVDRSTYPYGSRPFQGILGTDGVEGNLNVFSSQIEQLKRIKAGNLHGVLWRSFFYSPSADGTITFSFTEGTKTVNVLSTDSASDVAEKVAQISTSDYTITHPIGYDYVVIEALSNSVDTIPTISSSVVTITSKVIANKESYSFTNNPNVVIIAGGKNDSVDSDAKVESYQSQILHQESVYYKTRDEQSPTQGTIYIPTNTNDVDRTCFCGSLRHLIEEIHTLYEDAFIVVVGPSNLNYGGVNINNDKKKDEQLAEAAAYLSMPYISWFKNGIMCNRLFNKPTGSGTQNDPYIINVATDYTLDMMHANYEGGKYLANVVATTIRGFIKNLL